MSPPATAKLRVGDWCVNPAAGQMSRGGDVVRLEARTLRLLLDLADHPGQVVSIDALLDRVWAGVIVTPDSVYQAVAALRRLLGDDPRRPSYIATVPRLGYRLVARVEPWTEEPAAPGPAQGKGRRGWTWGAAAALVAALLAAGLLIQGQVARNQLAAAARQPVTVGVLPFLDLTPNMDELPLADDVTEGLIDKLSRNPGLRTPGFRASFSLRGKHASPAQAARTLGVAYLVDGSVRRFGGRLRVAARLMRADNGFVIWSQSYDRPLSDYAAIQDAIAGSVGAVLRPAKPAKRAES